MPRVGSNSRSVSTPVAIQRRDGHLLLVAARQPPHLALRARVDLQPLDGLVPPAPPRRASVDRRPRTPPAPRNGSAMFSRTDCCISSASARSPGTSVSPAAMASAGCANSRGLPVDLDRRRGRAAGTPPAPRKARPAPAPPAPRPPAPRPACRSKDTSVELVPVAQAPDRQPRRAARGAGRRAPRRGRRRCATAPSIISTICSSIPGTIGTDPHRHPVAQHRRAVADLRDLGEAVRDVDDRPVPRPPAPAPPGSRSHEVRRQGRRHLVQQQHIRLDRQRPRKIEDAQRGQRQVPRSRPPAAGPGRPSSSTQSRTASTGVLAQPQVVAHRQVGDQRRLLIDRDQPRPPRRGGRGRLPSPPPACGHGPLSGLQRPGQDLHERRFARAVRAHQRHNLAPSAPERGVASAPRTAP